MLAKLEHLSYSSIDRYLLCPRSWWFKYVQRVPSPTSVSMALGTAVHRAVEHTLKLIHAGIPVRVEAVWTEAWEAATEQEIDWAGELPEQCCNQGYRLFAHAAAQAEIENLTPLVDGDGLYIERLVELRVPGVPVPIIGYIDLIGADGVPVDLKTSSKSWTQDQAQRELQPLFYLAALNQCAYLGNPNYQFKHVVFVKTKTPQVQVLTTQREPRELLRLCILIQSVWQDISSDVFPANPTCWKCSERWCEYWSQCRGR